MLSKNGIAEKDDIARFLPPDERMKRGAVAIIECFQKIPCDPCFTSCPKGAIKPFANINDLPRIDFELCDGCGICVAGCPGIAIFVIDMTYGDDEALLKLPHEFVPLPQKGEIVALLDRRGKAVAKGKVVRSIKFNDRTSVVWVTAPKEMAMDIRAVAPKAYEVKNPLRTL